MDFANLLLKVYRAHQKPFSNPYADIVVALQTHLGEDHLFLTIGQPYLYGPVVYCDWSHLEQAVGATGK